MNNRVPERIQVVAFDKRVQFFEGMAYGLEQPTVLIYMGLRKWTTESLTILEESMSRFITKPFKDSSVGTEPGAHALIARIHHFYIAIQRQYNIPVYGPYHKETMRQHESSDDIEIYPVALPYSHRNATINVLQWIFQTINRLLMPRESKSVSMDNIVKDFTKLEAQLRQVGGTSTNPIHFLDAAYKLSLPVTSLSKGFHAFGTGSRSRWLHSSITDNTPGIGVALAKNKMSAAKCLSMYCLPAPHHVPVSSEEQAIKAAHHLTYPVVVKPNDQDQGLGVFAGICTEDSLRKAYQATRKITNYILIEKHFEGEDYRFTVMHDRVIKIMHRSPGRIIGDGRNTIEELVRKSQANEEMQKAFQRTGKWRLMLDDEANDLLAEQHLNAESIPKLNQVVVLRRKSNISTGGTHSTLPVTEAHPDNCYLAVRAASVFGLDLAGVDIIMPDARKSWLETGAVICEVNAQPQIGLRDTPDIYLEILQHLMPKGGTVPVHLLVADDEIDELFDICHNEASKLGCNGFSNWQGVWIDDRQCVWKPSNSFVAARALLLDKRMHSGLLVMRIRDIARFGIPVTPFNSFRVITLQNHTDKQKVPIANSDNMAVLKRYAGYVDSVSDQPDSDMERQKAYRILQLKQVLNFSAGEA